MKNVKKNLQVARFITGTSVYDEPFYGRPM